MGPKPKPICTGSRRGEGSGPAGLEYVVEGRTAFANSVPTEREPQKGIVESRNPRGRGHWDFRLSFGHWVPDLTLPLNMAPSHWIFVYVRMSCHARTAVDPLFDARDPGLSQATSSSPSKRLAIVADRVLSICSRAYCKQTVVPS